MRPAGQWSRAHWTEADGKALAAHLLSLAEPEYLAFHSKLIQTAAPLHGVRLPLIRALAKEICRGNWRAYLDTVTPLSYEEIMLRGLVIGQASGGTEEILAYTKKFLPLIDNWAVNDSFASALKLADRERPAFWNFVESACLPSPEEFTQRFGVTILLFHFLTEEYIDRVLTCCESARHEGYYVKMAVAWTLSMCYVKFPDKTLPLLQERRLEPFTHNKTIQKCVESRQLSPADKSFLRTLRLP